MLTLLLTVIGTLSHVHFIQGQNLLFSGNNQGRFIPNLGTQQNDFLNQQQPSPFQHYPTFSQLDSYIPQGDLQTSDIPTHLQETLPQYRFSTKRPNRLFDFQNQNIFQNHELPRFQKNFHYAQNILPSTHRPDYSIYFNEHQRDNNFKTPLSDDNRQNIDKFQELNQLDKFARFDEQSAQTRNKGHYGDINDLRTKPRHNMDFTSNSVSRNLDNRANILNHRTVIFASDSLKPTKNPSTKTYFVNNEGEVFTTSTPSVIPLREFRYKKPQEIKNNVFTTTESTLEMATLPITSKTIVSIPLKLTQESMDELRTTNNSSKVDEEEYDYEDASNDSSDEDYYSDLIDQSQELPKVEDNAQHHNETTKISSTDSSLSKQNAINYNSSLVENIKTSPNNVSNINEVFHEENNTGSIVSVVTTRSVVNNTVTLPPSIIIPTTLRTILNEDDNTTDTWIVIASVQTSRSVSGTRYLPSQSVIQDEFVQKFEEITENVTTTTPLDEEMYTTILPPTTSTTSATIKQKMSTESLIDKLDRVQSDLSTSLLTDGFKNKKIAVITENMTEQMEVTTMLDITSPQPAISSSTKKMYPLVNIKKLKFGPHSTVSSTQKPRKLHSTTVSTTTEAIMFSRNLKENYPTENLNSNKIESPLPIDLKENQENAKVITNITKNSVTIVPNILDTNKSKEINNILSTAKEVDISAFLPPGYKLTGEQNITNKSEKSNDTSEKLSNHKMNKISESKKFSELFTNSKVDDIGSFLPAGYKLKTTTSLPSSKSPIIETENIPTSLLPPGYKKPYQQKSSTHEPTIINSTKNASSANSKTVSDLFKNSKIDDISAFLPPGYKPSRNSPTKSIKSENVPTSLLPPGYKARVTQKTTTESTTSSSSKPVEMTTKSGGFKVVFPSRPGSTKRKSATRLTTPKLSDVEEVPRVTPPTIHKGWPSRATTEFTGWPTPSTTPISIEKLLEAARTSTSKTNPEILATSTTETTTTTVTVTTPTPRYTTPGVCAQECNLAGTIKLVEGAKWTPELLDRNTKEWQELANEVQYQLDQLYSKSKKLNGWYRKLRIDSFSEGSILVDYLVELNIMEKKIDTLQLKNMFLDSLFQSDNKPNLREGKALNTTHNVTLGKFVIDPMSTDFVVLPKQVSPTIGYTEDNIFLPQWAIAVIVIGLASLLFVMIFGVTVLVNRQKNSKKKSPSALTEEMLNELNKNHMGGINNFGAKDTYNMDEVWNQRSYDDNKLPLKKSSSGFNDIYSTNIYDSWRSEWNGYYYDAYGRSSNHPSSSHYEYSRKYDSDTNF